MADQYSDLTFPVLGVEQDAEVGAQRPGTTAVGVNVRAMDPRTRRLRGGSRPGLSRYVAERVGGLNSELQHLAVIVGVDTDSTAAAVESGTGVVGGWDGDDLGPANPTPSEYPADWVPWPDEDDERFPLGPPYVPPGGTGVNPDPTVTPLDPPSGGSSSGWRFHQKKSATFAQSGVGVATRTDSVTLDEAPEDNQFVLVCYGTQHGPSAGGTSVPNLSCSDNLGNTYTQLDVTRSVASPGRNTVLAAWWARLDTVGASLEVSVTQDESAVGAGISGAILTVIEYRGLETSTPFEHDGGATGDVFLLDTADLGPGAIDSGGTTRLSVAVIRASGFFYDTVEAADGWVTRDFQDSVAQDELIVIDDLSTPSGSQLTPFVTWSRAGGDSFTWAAVGGSFRYR